MKGLDVARKSDSRDPGDRRQDVRIAVPSDLKLELSDQKIRARALDISEGGALVESNLPLVVGATYKLTFCLGWVVAECQATTAHSRRLDGGRWLSGLKLTPHAGPSPLADLIDRITERAIKFS